MTILIYRSRSWSADHFLIWSQITFYHFSRSRSWSDRRSLFYWSWSDFKITFFQITQFWQGLSISKNSTFIILNINHQCSMRICHQTSKLNHSETVCQNHVKFHVRFFWTPCTKSDKWFPRYWLWKFAEKKCLSQHIHNIF